eukprot:m.171067 g.171067  ORF g.171067 m.171067 type:complete len:1824 (+) comp14546_c0_seq5:148-5619(+)
MLRCKPQDKEKTLHLSVAVTVKDFAQVQPAGHVEEKLYVTLPGEDEAIVKYECVFERTLLTLFGEDGTIFYVTLPFTVQKALALQHAHALLLVRACARDADDELPILYTLGHPLEELKPMFVDDRCRAAASPPSPEEETKQAFRAQLSPLCSYSHQGTDILLVYDDRVRDYRIATVEPQTGDAESSSLADIMLKSATTVALPHKHASAQASTTNPGATPAVSVAAPAATPVRRQSSDTLLSSKGSPLNGQSPSPSKLMRDLQSQDNVEGEQQQGKAVLDAVDHGVLYPAFRFSLHSPLQVDVHHASPSALLCQGAGGNLFAYIQDGANDRVLVVELAQSSSAVVSKPQASTTSDGMATATHLSAPAAVPEVFITPARLSTAEQQRPGTTAPQNVLPDGTWGVRSKTPQHQLVGHSVHPVSLFQPLDTGSTIPTSVIVFSPDKPLQLHVGLDHVVMLGCLSSTGTLESIKSLDHADGTHFFAETSMGQSYWYCVDILPESDVARRIFGTIQAACQDEALSLPAMNRIWIDLLRNFIPLRDSGLCEWTALKEACCALVGGPRTSPEDLEASSATRHCAVLDPVWKTILGSVGIEQTTPSVSPRQQSLAAVTSDMFLREPALLSLVYLLHTLFLEYIVQQYRPPSLPQFTALLSKLACLLGWSEYTAFYRHFCPGVESFLWHHNDTTSSPGQQVQVPKGTYPRGFSATPFDVFEWIQLQILEPASATDCIATSKRVTPFLHIVLRATQKLGSLAPTQTVVRIAEAGLTRRTIARLHMDLQYMLLHNIFDCLGTPQPGWKPAVYNLIQREDMGLQATEVQNFSKDALRSIAAEYNADRVSAHKKNQGTELQSTVTAMRFPLDQRVREAQRLLNSSEAVPVHLMQVAGMNDHDFLTAQTVRLAVISQRTCALSVGRGMLTLCTFKPVMTQGIQIPTLEMLGRAVVSKTIISPDATTTTPEYLCWPSFHNGVAAALRLAHPSQVRIGTTWIAYHQRSAENKTDEHAGFLMGLGLLGHLTELRLMDLYMHLSEGHRTTSLALLLGLAAAKAGTMDTGIIKMLSLHNRALLPPTSAEVEVCAMVQSAALFGVGLVHMGSAHRRMTEVMLDQIGQAPCLSNSGPNERYSYSLSAGFALGFLLLGKGNSAPGLKDLQIEDRLHGYIFGARQQLNSRADVKSERFIESSVINTTITTPSAVVGLALMYLKTNNAAVAARLQIPDTQFLLEQLRPHDLMLMAIAHTFVLWDEVQPTADWVLSHVPDVVRDFSPFDELPQDIPDTIDLETHQQAFIYTVAGACAGLGYRFAGTGNDCALKVLLSWLSRFSEALSKETIELLRKQNVETCISAIATAAAMVMAGTGDLRVLRVLRPLHARLTKHVSYGAHMAIHSAIGLLFLGGATMTLGRSNKAIASLLAAFYPRFATDTVDNTYHLQALRHMYVLAVEPRSLITFDTVTQQPVHVPVVVTLTASGVEGTRLPKHLHLVTPLILPAPLNDIESISVSGQRFFPHTVFPSTNRVHRESLQYHMSLFVKLKPGCRPYHPESIALGDYAAQAEAMVGIGLVSQTDASSQGSYSGIDDGDEGVLHEETGQLDKSTAVLPTNIAALTAQSIPLAETMTLETVATMKQPGTLQLGPSLAAFGKYASPNTDFLCFLNEIGNKHGTPHLVPIFFAMHQEALALVAFADSLDAAAPGNLDKVKWIDPVGVTTLKSLLSVLQSQEQPNQLVSLFVKVAKRFVDKTVKRVFATVQVKQLNVMSAVKASIDGNTSLQQGIQAQQGVSNDSSDVFRIATLVSALLGIPPKVLHSSTSNLEQHTHPACSQLDLSLISSLS